ncbi:hypothetical protein E9993_06885 [Labilibacter sediminis]|nr:hypothetical protein E9993_06885 [Labilibacter sediminis]
MIKSFVLALFSLFTVVGFSQNYARVDSIVRNYKKSYATPKKLAIQINYDFASDAHKARAIYTWMADNIAYDYKKSISKKKYIRLSYKTTEQKYKKLSKLDDEKIQQTFKRKKGICGDYAIVFHRLCQYCGLECKIVSGTSKVENSRIGKKPGRTDHAWNAVKINGHWNLVDVTWGAGYVDPESREFTFRYEDFYFCTPPEKFFLKHYPKDTTFLYVTKSKEDFANLPLYSESYMKDNVSIWPNTGIINFKENEELTFKVSSSENLNSLAYVFNKDKYTVRLPNVVNKEEVFKITSPNKTISYLTIFVNGNVMVTYKLIKSR